jgi:hypothetical protein
MTSVKEIVSIYFKCDKSTLLASYALDSVSLRDYAADTIVCGPRFDRAYINPVDGDTASSDCESILAETSQ